MGGSVTIVRDTVVEQATRCPPLQHRTASSSQYRVSEGPVSPSNNYANTAPSTVESPLVWTELTTAANNTTRFTKTSYTFRFVLHSAACNGTNGLALPKQVA